MSKVRFLRLDSEAWQWTNTLRTDLSTVRPTNRIRLKITTASEQKNVATGRFGPLPLSPLACLAAALGPHCVGLTLPNEGKLWFWYWFCLMLQIILRFVSLLWFIIKKCVLDWKPFYPLKGWSVGGSAQKV